MPVIVPESSLKKQRTANNYIKTFVLSLAILVRVSIVMKHHDHSNSYNEKHLTEACLQFTNSVHHGHVSKHDYIQAIMVLE